MTTKLIRTLGAILFFALACLAAWHWFTWKAVIVLWLFGLGMKMESQINSK